MTRKVSLQKVVPLGIHTNVNTYAAVSYWSCFVFFCRRFWRFFIICFLSPSCVVRYLHLRFVGLFVYFVVRAVTIPYVPCSEYGLVPVCAVSFMLNFVSCLLDSNFIFSFCGCPFFSSSSGMVTTTQGVFSLLPIGRHLCSFARILGYGPRCFGLQRRQNCPTVSSAL